MGETREPHTVGAFKIRGALFYVSELRRKNPEIDGVIVATRGNFGQSIAFAGIRAGLRAQVVVPHGNSQEQNTAMRSLGAEVIEFGRDFQDAPEHAGRLSKESGLHFINSFDFVLVQGVAMRIYFSATHNVAEGAAAAPWAALFQEQKIVRGKRIALIHSGCNIDRERFASILAG